jgi:hypothetical protein
MSVFGKMDAASIPNNPFFVEKGEYSAIITDASIGRNKDDVRQLTIKYEITDENSDYYEKPLTQWFTLVDEDMDEEQIRLLDPDTRKQIRRAQINLKKTLCGQPQLGRKGLGVDENDLNGDDWNPKVLVHKEVNIAVYNYGPDSMGVGIQWVELKE